MEGITIMLFILVGFNVDWLSGACIYQSYTKMDFTLQCETDEFVVEGVNSMMHCAYKCQLAERCEMFQHSMTTKKCKWCSGSLVNNGEQSDAVAYRRILAVTPDEERDAVCIATCGVDPQDACFSPTASFEVLRNETCFETCKYRFALRFNAYETDQNNYCLCGFEDSPLDLNDFCQEVCQKQGRFCGDRALYFFKSRVNC